MTQVAVLSLVNADLIDEGECSVHMGDALKLTMGGKEVHFTCSRDIGTTLHFLWYVIPGYLPGIINILAKFLLIILSVHLSTSKIKFNFPWFFTDLRGKLPAYSGSQRRQSRTKKSKCSKYDHQYSSTDLCEIETARKVCMISYWFINSSASRINGT